MREDFRFLIQYLDFQKYLSPLLIIYHPDLNPGKGHPQDSLDIRDIINPDLRDFLPGDFLQGPLV